VGGFDVAAGLFVGHKSDDAFPALQQFEASVKYQITLC